MMDELTGQRAAEPVIAEHPRRLVGGDGRDADAAVWCLAHRAAAPALWTFGCIPSLAMPLDAHPCARLSTMAASALMALPDAAEGAHSNCGDYAACSARFLSGWKRLRNFFCGRCVDFI